MVDNRLRKRHNQAFMIEDEAEFVRFMVAEIPAAPPEAAKIRAIIQASRPSRPDP
jgi:hypothetical protein